MLLLWRKGHCSSKCPKKDKIAKNDWVVKKGAQMVQDLSDDASESKETNTQNDETESTEDEKKHVHWSGVQMQGFQSHQHMQLFQGETTIK